MKKGFLAIILSLVILFGGTVPALASTTTTQDVQPPWNEDTSMHLFTNNKFRALTMNGICMALVAKFGGSYTTYTSIANTIFMAGYTTTNATVYEDVHYYWQSSGDDEQPYRVKQFIVYYSDYGKTNYLGSSTRIYLSTNTF